MEGNFLQAINPNSIIKGDKFKEIGHNDYLNYTYKTNGKDYQVVSDIYDTKYTLTGTTVDSICDRTGFNKEEIMDILFVVYDAYDDFKSFVDTLPDQRGTKKYMKKIIKKNVKNKKTKKYMKKIQDKMIDVISELITKYKYEDVLSYLNSMNTQELMSLFNGQDSSVAWSKINEHFSYEDDKSYDSEQEELVSRFFNV